MTFIEVILPPGQKTDGHVDHQRQHRPCRNPEIFHKAPPQCKDIQHSFLRVPYFSKFINNYALSGTVARRPAAWITRTKAGGTSSFWRDWPMSRPRMTPLLL